MLAHIAIYIFLQSRLSPLETVLATGRKLVLCLYREMSLRDTDFVDSCSVAKSTWTGWWSPNATSSHSGALGMSWGTGTLYTVYTLHPTLS